MSEGILYVLGFLAGIAFVAVLCTFLAMYRKKKGKPCGEYDERQILARGTAFKSAFFSSVFYMIACALADIMEIRWAEVSVQMFFGLFFSIAVFVSVCIVKDAYFTFDSKKVPMIAVFFAVIVLNTVPAIETIAEGESFVTNGLLNTNCINIGAAAVFVVCLTVLLIKSIADRKTAGCEE